MNKRVCWTKRRRDRGSERQKQSWWDEGREEQREGNKEVGGRKGGKVGGTDR